MHLVKKKVQARSLEERFSDLRVRFSELDKPVQDALAAQIISWTREGLVTEETTNQLLGDRDI
jgi:hypothetical protein